MNGHIAVKMGAINELDIPVQMFCDIDFAGKITPVLFRYRNSNEQIEKVSILEILARNERNHDGVREKQYVCNVLFGNMKKAIELRFDVDRQKWRIFQVLS